MTWGVNNTEKSTDQQKQVNNVSSTVPTVTTASGSPEIKYSSNVAYLAGISKVIGGILCLILGLLQCYALARMHLLGRVLCGYGELSGIILIVNGAVAINASKRKTEKRIAASMGLSFVSVAVGTAVWVYMIVFAATKYWFIKYHMFKCGRGRRHHGRHDSSRSNSDEHHGSRDWSHDRHGDRHERSVFDRDHGGKFLPVAWLVVTICIFVLLTAMIAAAIVQAVVTYRAYKRRNQYRKQEDETTYIVPFKTKEKMLADIDDLPKVKNNDCV